MSCCSVNHHPRAHESLRLAKRDKSVDISLCSSLFALTPSLLLMIPGAVGLDEQPQWVLRKGGTGIMTLSSRSVTVALNSELDAEPPRGIRVWRRAPYASRRSLVAVERKKEPGLRMLISKQPALGRLQASVRVPCASGRTSNARSRIRAPLETIRRN